MAGPKKGPDLWFYRKNRVNINLTITPVDLTGERLLFTVKPDFDDDQEDLSAVISKDVTEDFDVASGKVVVTLTEDDTNIVPDRYVYDFKLDNAGITLTVGNLTVEPTVTLRG